MKWIVPVAAAVTLAVTNLAVARSAATPHDVLLARDRTEPTVAVDPTHPWIVVATANTDYSRPVAGTYPTAYYWSSNGGRSFSSGTAPEVPPYTTGADTTVAIARDGTVFYSYLGETPTYCSGGTSAVIVTHSVDHGRSYRAPMVVDTNGADDKPNMAVESVSAGPAHLFLTWSRYHAHGSEVWFSRSTNGGTSYTRAVRLFTSGADNFGTVPVAAPHHTVYVLWSSFPEFGLSSVVPTHLEMMVSHDDGVHFGAPRAVTPTFAGIPQVAQPGSLRSLTMPAVAEAPSGTLYLAWAAVSHDRGHGQVQANIWVKRSTDGGVRWSAPVRVNDRLAGDRFMPAIAYLGHAEVGLAFYDRRNGPDRLDVYAARVRWHSGGYAGPNVQLDTRPSYVHNVYYLSPTSTCFSPGRFFGDYIGVAATPTGELCAGWADTQLGVTDETDVWFSHVALASPARRLRADLSSGTRRNAR